MSSEQELLDRIAYLERDRDFWKGQQELAANVAATIADLDEEAPALRQMLRKEIERRKRAESAVDAVQYARQQAEAEVHLQLKAAQARIDAVRAVCDLHEGCGDECSAVEEIRAVLAAHYYAPSGDHDVSDLSAGNALRGMTTGQDETWQRALGVMERSLDKVSAKRAEAEAERDHLKDENVQMHVQLARIRALHRQYRDVYADETGDSCAHCNTFTDAWRVPWPCPTIQALNDPVFPAPGKETESGYRPVLLDISRDETLHPRGADGRFVPKSLEGEP